MHRVFLRVWRIGITAILCALSLVHASDAPPHKQIRYLMGTLCEIEAYGEESKTDDAISAAFDELKRIDALLSNWKADSELMQFNRAAGAAGAPRPWITVSPELFQRIQVALHVAKETDGLFDPTVGPLVRAYGFLPTADGGSQQQSLGDIRSRVGWEKIKLNPDSHAIQFDVPGMEIDLGGIAKGYAAGRATQVLRAHGIVSGLVSLGGSSVAAIGAPPGLKAWYLTIRDPRDDSSPAAFVELGDGESLSTSGTYRNIKGQGKGRRSHIINPRTGQPIRGLSSVTVLTTDAEVSDALTKPFFFAPDGEQERWAKWLASFENTSVILLRSQGRALERITAGAHPERFGRITTSADGNAAKANRRSAQHLARDGEGSAGHSSCAPQARGSETNCAEGYDSAHVSRDSGASLY